MNIRTNRKSCRRRRGRERASESRIIEEIGGGSDIVPKGFIFKELNMRHKMTILAETREEERGKETETERERERIGKKEEND